MLGLALWFLCPGSRAVVPSAAGSCGVEALLTLSLSPSPASHGMTVRSFQLCQDSRPWYSGSCSVCAWAGQGAVEAAVAPPCLSPLWEMSES